jgi:hypothetical protein
MMQVGLGHQVLGQMLIAGTGELAVAGAAVMVAATDRVKHPGAQFAIRTAAPAIAVQTIFARREEALLRRERDLLQRERQLHVVHDERTRQRRELQQEHAVMKQANADLHTDFAALASSYVKAQGEAGALAQAHGVLQSEAVRLRQQRALSDASLDAFHEAITRARDEIKSLKALYNVDLSIARRRGRHWREEHDVLQARIDRFDRITQLTPELAAKKQRAKRRANNAKKRKAKKPKR